MRQLIVKDLRRKTKAKAEDLTSKAKAKDFMKCPRSASRPRPWPRGLHHCVYCLPSVRTGRFKHSFINSATEHYY